jgi:hypothetical protein
MAGLSKDVELIFKGTDNVTPTIKNVRKNVADLTSAIQDQLQAADKGEGSINDLAKAYGGLKAAQGDVNEIVKVATAYERQTVALGEQSAKVADAKAKLEALNAQVSGAEAPTKRLANARDAAERKLAAALAKEQELAAAVRESGSALEAAGGDSKDFAHTLDMIRTAALETARALRDAAAAKETFGTRQAAGQGNIAAAGELDQFNKLAAGSGLPQAQIAFLSTLDGKLQALNAAIREDQASMAALNAELSSRASGDAASRAAALKTQLEEADAAAKRLAATQGFRQMATEIEAGARDISRFGAQLDSNAASGRRFADTIQSILAPTQAATTTLAGLDSVLAQAESVMDGTKRRTSEYNAELNNLQSASAGINGIAKLIDDFERQSAATATARSEMEAAQAEVLKLSSDMKQAAAPTQEMANALKQAEANLENAGRAFQTESAKLNTLDASLKKTGVDTRNLALAQTQLTAAAERAAAAQSKVAAKTSGKGSFLGLRPDEMTNLGYQINDIVVSLASGQAPGRVFLQQGAQIGQIIPGAFSKIIRFAGPLAIIGTILFTVASAMKKSADEAQHLQTGIGIVAELGNGSKVTAAEFAALADTLDKAGVKADDARKALVQLGADGLNTNQMKAYLDTAQAVADVTGVKLTDALETVRSSFQGGMEDIIKLQKETGIYSDAELDLIQNLYDQGKADEARTTALQIYETKMQGIAAQQAGPWKIATDQLSQAWSNFLGWLGRTEPFEAMKRNLHALALGAAFTAAVINNVASGKGLDLDGATRIAMGLKLPGASVAKPAAADPNRHTAAGREIARDDALKLQIANARTPAEKKLAQALQVRRNAEKEAAQAGLSTAETQAHIAAATAAANSKFDEAQGKRDASAEKRRESAARAAAKRAAAAAKALKDEQEAIQKGVEQIDVAAEKKGGESLQSKLRAVDEQYAKLFRDIDEYSRKTNGKGLIGGLTIAQVREHIKAQEQILKNYVQMGDYEEKIGDLEKERDEKLKDIADQVARGILSPEDGLNQSKAVIDDIASQVADMAQEALAFATALEEAKPSPQLEAFIAKMRALMQTNALGNAGLKASTTKSFIDAGQTDLNKMVQERTALIDRENVLVATGVETYAAAQKKIQGFYKDTNKAIQDQINHILALAEAFKNGTPEQQRYYKALAAGLATVSQESEGSSQSFINLKAKITDILTTNIVGFINSVAGAFAKMVSGQESVLGFLAEIGRAFLSMIANILQTVATLIIEALVLDAVDKATGGILKPLLQVTAAAVQIRHEGGVIGEPAGRTRNVSPLAFANAPRYHGGGIAGLAPDEHAAILRKGEEVLTEADPRHRDNGGLQSGGKGPTGIRQVLAVGDDEIAAAMAGGAGEKVILTHIRRNRASIKQSLEL